MRLIVVPRVVSPRFVSSWGVSRRFSWWPSAGWSSAVASAMASAVASAIVSIWASAWASSWAATSSSITATRVGWTRWPSGVSSRGCGEMPGWCSWRLSDVLYMGREFPRLIGLVGEKDPLGGPLGVPSSLGGRWGVGVAGVWNVNFSLSVGEGLLRLWWKVQ